MDSMMYIVTETWPDIANAASKVSQFAVNPGASYLKDVKHIFQYINGTQDLSFLFCGYKTQQLVRYLDADWGRDWSKHRSTTEYADCERDLSTHCSTTGYAFYVFGCFVSWFTKKQPTVSLSSCEAEYIVATQVTKELLFLRRRVEEIQLLPVETPLMTILHSDNQSAIQLEYNPEFYAQTKNINIQPHFLQKVVASEVMDIV